MSLWWTLVLAAAGTVYGVARELLGWRRPAVAAWKLPLSPPVLGAHRGGAALFPENTLAAFLGSRERFDCRFMELDVRASREGVPVVIHDATVDRTTDGTGAVAALSLPELERLDAGRHFLGLDGASWAGRGVGIPTLEAVLRALPTSVFSVEIKQHDPPCEQAVVDVVRKAGMEQQVLLGSARHGTFLRIQALAPEIPSFFSSRSSVVFFLSAWLGLARWYRPPHQALLLPGKLRALKLVTSGIVRTAHQLGLPLMVWTVDDPSAMERLLEMGVDGIITDRPDLLAQLLKERRPGLGREP